MRTVQTSIIKSLLHPPQSRLLPQQPVYLTRRYKGRLVKPLNFAMYPQPATPAHVSKVLVFGAGNFGSCLADHLGDSKHAVFIWSRDAKFVKHFNSHHRNPDYLKDHLFSQNIQAVGPEMPNKEFIRGMEVLLFAIPTQAVRYVYYVSGRCQMLKYDNCQGNSH
jgi:hypothetical protein